MDKRQRRIEHLVGLWMEARTTEAEERELRELLHGEAELPDSLRDMALLFEGFGALAAERMPAGRSTGVRLPVDRLADNGPLSGQLSDRDSVILSNDRSRSRRTRIWWVAVAAAVAALGLFLGAELLRKPYCYIDGKPVYDKTIAMQTTAYFDGFAVLETSDRLVDELMENN